MNKCLQCSFSTFIATGCHGVVTATVARDNETKRIQIAMNFKGTRKSTVKLVLTVTLTIGGQSYQHDIMFTCDFGADKIVASVLKRHVKSY